MKNISILAIIVLLVVFVNSVFAADDFKKVQLTQSDTVLNGLRTAQELEKVKKDVQGLKEGQHSGGVVVSKDTHAQQTGNRALAWAVRLSVIKPDGTYPDIETVEAMLSPIERGNMAPLSFETAVAKAIKAKGWTLIEGPVTITAVKPIKPIQMQPSIDLSVYLTKTEAEDLFTSKEEFSKTNLDLIDTQTRVSGLSTEMIKISLDVANVMTAFEWEEAFDREGKPLGKVVKNIKIDKLPQDVKIAVADIGEIKSVLPKDKDGKFVLVASQNDLNQKADASYVDTEISRVKTNVADNIDNLRALALKKDKAYIFVYASYMLKNDEVGFRAWLQPQVSEKDFEEKFNDIKSKAEEAKAKKIVKF